MRPSSLLLAAALASLTALAALTVTGCSSCGGGSSSPAPGPSAASSSTPAASAAAGKPPPPAPSRQGNAVGRAAEDDALYIADEDSSVLHIVPLPFDKEKPARSVALPGRPAQVLPLADRVLVTIRDPGLLLVMRRDAAAGLVEAARVSLPADAWGIAITKDEKTALVSSAWTHKVSGVDLGTAKVRFSVDVAREPRGIAVMGDGSRAYVSHLVGSALTRIDGIGTEQPSVKRVALPAGPLRVVPRSTRSAEASLGYSLVLSPDEKRLYAARHALGAIGGRIWAGAPTVDVLLTRDDKPLAPPLLAEPSQGTASLSIPSEESTLGTAPADLVQPRAMVFRRTRNTLLVLSEGLDALVELEALSLDPSSTPTNPIQPSPRLSTGDRQGTGCGAPSGVALSSDERVAYVFCRSTRTLGAISPDPPPGQKVPQYFDATFVRLGAPPGDAGLVEGRQVFYDATKDVVSGGLGCAGCHPEGRDDGYTWIETSMDQGGGTFLSEGAPGIGYPRQTPMLAGRVAAKGPYGWHAESPELVDRVLAGFQIHRWERVQGLDPGESQRLAAVLVEFLRRGLVPPPRTSGELSAIEKRGKEIFESAEVGCRACHVGPEYTDRVAVPLASMLFREGFAHEAEKNFKTPSLLHVGGTPPYYHDGSAATLEELIEQNRDRMGKTSHLSAEDRAALVAFLRTL